MTPTSTKKFQGYSSRPFQATCSNCKWCIREMKMLSRLGVAGTWEANVPSKCGVGGFDIKPKGRCKMWEAA